MSEYLLPYEIKETDLWKVSFEKIIAVITQMFEKSYSALYMAFTVEGMYISAAEISPCISAITFDTIITPLEDINTYLINLITYIFKENLPDYLPLTFIDNKLIVPIVWKYFDIPSQTIIIRDLLEIILDSYLDVAKEYCVINVEESFRKIIEMP